MLFNKERLFSPLLHLVKGFYFVSLMNRHYLVFSSHQKGCL
jgi:hypothetical protein